MIISTAASAKSKSWTNKDLTWAELGQLLFCSITKTAETKEFFNAQPPEIRGAIKDVGGIVAFSLKPKQTRRKLENMDVASCVIFDADKAGPDLITKLKASGYKFLAYTTRSHTPENPRYRVIFELDRTVTPAEYMHIIQRLAEDFGVDNFCGSSFRCNQVMFFGSYSSDAAIPEFIDHPGGPVNVVETLKRPFTKELFEDLGLRSSDRRADPRKDTGIVGAFCRIYTVQDAINQFIPDIYTPTEDPDRWQRVGGTTPGLVIYDDALAYSHHGSHDLAADGHDHSAFDLVCLHKFGDDKVVCIDYIKNNCPEVCREEREKAFLDPDPNPDMQWAEGLKLDIKEKTGEIARTPENCYKIIKSMLKDSIANNVLSSDTDVLKDLVWRKAGEHQTFSDMDIIQIRMWFIAKGVAFNKMDIEDSVSDIAQQNKYNPLIKKLDSFTWDKTKRIETFFIEALKVEDNCLNRLITKKWFAACIQRAYHPGCKFDNMLMLVGPQNIGKSTTLNRLSLGYFTDQIKLKHMEGIKDGQEMIRGIWLAEIGEITGRKANKDALKQFLSSAVDRFRPAYGRRVINAPRITILVGTTNNKEQLTDESGNRRFWMLECFGRGNLFDFNPEQLWAEARDTLMDESLVIDWETEKLIDEKREEFFDEDIYESKIREFLEVLIPNDWYDKPLIERISASEFIGGTVKRNRICIAEIWHECLGQKLNQLCSRTESWRIGAILRKIFKSGPTGQRIRGYGLVKAWKRS